MLKKIEHRFCLAMVLLFKCNPRSQWPCYIFTAKSLYGACCFIVFTDCVIIYVCTVLEFDFYNRNVERVCLFVMITSFPSRSFCFKIIAFTCIPLPTAPTNPLYIPVHTYGDKVLVRVSSQIDKTQTSVKQRSLATFQMGDLTSFSFKWWAFLCLLCE